MTRFTVAFTFTLIVGFVSTSQAALIAHWTGDGTAVDATGNGHDGTLTGVTYDTGVIGQAFKFDGANDYITVAGNAALQPPTISVAMWFKASSKVNDQLLLDSSHGTGQAGWAVQILGTFRNASQENHIDFAYGNGLTFPHVQSTSIITDNAWHHVLATLNGTDMRIYVDGMLENTTLYSVNPPVASTNNGGGSLRFGKHYALNRQFTGLLDDVRIYNTAVSSVPEPTSLAIFGIGALCMGAGAARRRKEKLSAA